MPLPAWYPENPPLYDIQKTYAENVASGPFFDGPIPERKDTKPRFKWLDFSLSSLVGVPAGPLLTAKWVRLAAQLGFDIVTYKTIRSEAHPSHRLPNVTYVDEQGKQVEPPRTLDQLTITNSFGMPSQSPDFLLRDLREARASLSEGQVLIVSVVGTPNRGVSFADDFVRTAVLAKEGGAEVIEANFSCPNVEKAEGILYLDPELVHRYTEKIAKAIRPVPLILKVGEFPDEALMRRVFLAAARGGARGLCGINSVSRQVTPPLDANREENGLCGAGIRNEALGFVRSASKIIQEDRLGLTLLGCGGIMTPEHFDLFFEAGADAALSATGMMWDPYLALRHHEHTKSHS